MGSTEIGIIGGSGLYDIPGLQDREEVEVETPFGSPSDSYRLGTLEGKKVAFLARHGRGHRLLPSELNYRANIFGFKKLGVKRILSASAVGSLKEEHAPLDFILPDQFVDRTRHRVSTFFGNGLVAHISFADPVCSTLRVEVAGAAEEIELLVKSGGTYLCMEGPAFSTRAESFLYRSWGMDIIGMTNLQEAKLAREAEICYITIAMVTDYDSWNEEEAAVNVETLIGYLEQNSENARRLIQTTIRRLPDRFDCSCQYALRNSLITDPSVISDETRQNLELIVGKYLSN